MMGVGAFIYGDKFTHYGFLASGYQGPGLLAIFIIMRGILELKYQSNPEISSTTHQIWFESDQ